MNRISGLLHRPVQMMCVTVAFAGLGAVPGWAAEAGHPSSVGPASVGAVAPEVLPAQDLDEPVAGSGAGSGDSAESDDGPGAGTRGSAEGEDGPGEGAGIGISAESDDGPGAQAGTGDEVDEVPTPAATTPVPAPPVDEPGPRPSSPAPSTVPPAADRGAVVPPQKDLADTGSDADTAVALGAAGSGVLLLGVAALMHARRRRG
ncbi:LPXTG cell wall anchor domain-containing protein [Streptomyces sp. NPDC051940]|uniref:LPXTG cell wall anchor domain-containing protein n=1 Tax=Streptomyces sp. NPDC051940 TaxID=3155675 RepID=UPI003449BA77